MLGRRLERQQDQLGNFVQNVVRSAQELDNGYDECRERVRCSLRLYDVLDHHLEHLRAQVTEVSDREMAGTEGDVMMVICV